MGGGWWDVVVSPALKREKNSSLAATFIEVSFIEVSTNSLNNDFTLRITIRCLEDDLGFDRSDASAPVESLDHEVCRAFVEKRSQSPFGAEKLRPITTNAEVYTLHAGRWRGATWHDADHNVVWLLGCGYHRSGEHTDVYPYLKDLDAKAELFPTAEDYEIFFELQDYTFARALVEEVPAILEWARGQSGTEIVALIADRIRIGVVFEIAGEIEVTWLAVSMRLLPGETELPPEWMPLLLAAFYPRVANPMDFQIAPQLPTRDARADETVFVDYRG